VPPVNALAAIVQAAVNTISLVIQTAINSLTLVVQTTIDAIALVIQPFGQLIPARRFSPIRSLIQPGIDPVTLVVETLFDTVAFVVEAFIDAIAPVVEALVNAVAAIIEALLVSIARIGHRHAAQHQAADHSDFHDWPGSNRPVLHGPAPCISVNGHSLQRAIWRAVDLPGRRFCRNVYLLLNRRRFASAHRIWQARSLPVRRDKPCPRPKVQPRPASMPAIAATGCA
jgi:hypothetical protein